ncbi:putative AcrB/AcrD/AcrF family protein [Brevibacillus phage Sundance]|uniref:putative AcrB/AcrD/AcrF family protein n=1 Tax=Brevibacillus phage Sundance TaxID=1691958 RepID=UPI0006BCBA77|nr:putative AcrB/AcrD/AcrF family protein [Brevibacillus phage Sundance]ALA47840.1 putative AcrB/AcrD/AcrF family protein [Brevibacillus phage Sundance]
MTKKELVEEILSIKEVDSKANLMKKSAPQLEGILEGLKTSQTLDATPVPITVTSANTALQIDVQTLTAQIKEQMLVELSEQIRKELDAEVKADIVQQDTVEIPVKPKSSKREIDRFEQIPVMNCTNGQLIYASRKTGAEWLFTNYGDIEYMEFQELLTMRSSQRRFFDEPFIIVMDDDAVEYLGLTKMYANIKNPSQIDATFKLAQTDFEQVLEKSPKGIKHLIISRAKHLYDSGELDSIKKINYINEKYGTDIGQRG